MDLNSVVKKGAWYLKYRTVIWSSVWFVVGLFGGNADRIPQYLPTLNYTNQEVQQKLQEYNQLLKKAQEIKKELDKVQDGGV